MKSSTLMLVGGAVLLYFVATRPAAAMGPAQRSPSPAGAAPSSGSKLEAAIVTSGINLGTSLLSSAGNRLTDWINSPKDDTTAATALSASLTAPTDVDAYGLYSF